jgi:hypothetical protein
MRGLRQKTALVTAASMGTGATIAATRADQRASSLRSLADAMPTQPVLNRQSHCHLQRFASVNLN